MLCKKESNNWLMDDDSSHFLGEDEARLRLITMIKNDDTHHSHTYGTIFVFSCLLVSSRVFSVEKSRRNDFESFKKSGLVHLYLIFFINVYFEWSQ